MMIALVMIVWPVYIHVTFVKYLRSHIHTLSWTIFQLTLVPYFTCPLRILMAHSRMMLSHLYLLICMMIHITCTALF